MIQTTAHYMAKHEPTKNWSVDRVLSLGIHLVKIFKDGEEPGKMKNKYSSKGTFSAGNQDERHQFTDSDQNHD